MYLRIYPWARICQRVPPLLPMSGTILLGGLLGMILAMLPENVGTQYGFRPFFTMAAYENLIWTIFPVLFDIES